MEDKEFKEHIKEIARLELKNSFADNLMQTLNSSFIFQYVQTLEEENQQLKDKLKKIEEYLTSYESISTIQGLNDTKENKNLDKNTMVEMTNRYLKVHDKILSIIKGDD